MRGRGPRRRRGWGGGPSGLSPWQDFLLTWVVRIVVYGLIILVVYWALSRF